MTSSEPVVARLVEKEDGPLATARQGETADTPAADRQLVDQLLARDPAAWRTFLERFERLVLTRVQMAARELSRPLDAAAAEDLCAEVFSRLVADDFHVLRQYEGRSMLSTWLCVVARRMAIRRLARERRVPAQGAIDGSQLGALAGPPDDDPLRRLLAGEERCRLAAAVDQLGERHRQLVCLLYFDGCSYREVSERLHMPMNSIGPTLARIQQKLRTALQEFER